MKKVLWIIVILLALGTIFYFVCYPALTEYLENKDKLTEEEIALTGKDQMADSLIKNGWEKPEVYVARRKDIPTIEKEFYALGYPDFLYIPGEDGRSSKDNNSGEKSMHDNGNQVFLYMDGTYYMTHAKIEVQVSSSEFNSVSLKNHVDSFTDFIKIVTDRTVSEEDKSLLLRKFTDAFNDSDSKSIEINGLTFKISLDKFYCLVILEC